MRKYGRELVALSTSFSSPLFLLPQNIIVNKALFQHHRFHSSCNHFDITQLKSSKPITEFPVVVHHATAIKNGSIQHLHVGNYIVRLYCKSTSFGHAYQLFGEIPQRDVRSWTILISGFSRVGSHRLALYLFSQMQKQRITPNQFTFSSVLKSCASAQELRIGKAIIGWILRNGIGLDIALMNSVLDFYVKCEAFDYARRFFESMSDKDTVSWNIMMGAYVQNGDMEEAEHFFSRLPVKDAASWNTIIDGHLHNGSDQIAVELLYRMVKTGPALTDVTFSIALVLASSLSHVELGKQIHGRLLRIRMNDDPFIKNSLIHMYSKCGELEKAWFVFGTLSKDVATTKSSKQSYGQSLADSVSLSSMVSGYIQNGRVADALRVFSLMASEWGQVDEFTLTTVLSACANSGLIELGQLIHGYILKSGQQPDVFVSSSMIDMYAKCGRSHSARSVFREAKVRNVVLWTAAISSHAAHGQGRDAIRLFELMQSEGVKPNEVTFVGVLTACSHAGLFDEGWKYFGLMKDVYAIRPKVEHYTCMVDLLGRAGRLNEIKDFIRTNDISHFSAVWKAFLSSCHVHKNVEMARWVSNKLYELEPSAPGSYVLMSKVCASDCRWEEAAMLKSMMQEKGIRKQPGQSWIQ